MTTLKRVLLILLTVVWCVGCDQATKSIAKSHLPKSQMLSFVGDTVRLQYTENKGAFLSLGASLSENWRGMIFTGGVATFLLGVLGYLLVASNLPAVGCSLSHWCWVVGSVTYWIGSPMAATWLTSST